MTIFLAPYWCLAYLLQKYNVYIHVGYNYNDPILDVCMYKGQPYYQGQSWQDGCEHNCFCEDGAIGRWRCSSV